MSGDFKINSNLFNSLNELIKNPFFVMDQQGNLFSYNKGASELFKNYEESKNIFDLIDPTSAEQLNSLIAKALTGDYPYKEPISLTSEISTKISIIAYAEDNHTFLFCELDKINAPYKIEKSIYDIESIQELDEKLTELIQYISYKFPLTLVGKDHLRNSLDGIDYVVWLEDLSGNFLIVNEEFQSLFKLKYSAIEGKPVKNYILPVYQGIWQSVNDVIRSEGLIIRLRNISLNGINVKGNQETIKIPLFDSHQNILGTLGVIKSSEGPYNKIIKIKGDGKEYFIPLIRNFHKAAAIISLNGTILNYNTLFTDIFKDGLFSFENIQIDKIFPAVLIDIINKFKESDKTELSTQYKCNISSFGRKIETFHVYLYKIINNEVIEGIFIMVEEEISSDDLESIIKKRGRMFEILLEQNPEPVFIYDTENLRFLEVNEPALALYGYKKEEFLQMDLTDLYTPEDIQTLLDSSVTKENYGKFSGPFRHRKKDGSSVFVEISKISFKFNEKDAHFNIIKDVSEKLELLKQIQLYKSAFNNSQSLVFITESNGFVTFANKAVFDVLKYTKEDIDNTSFAAFVKNEERGVVNTSIFQSHIKDAVSLYIELKKADGSLLSSEVNASPVLDYKGEIESFIIVCNYDNKTEIKEIIKEVPVELPIQKNISSEMDKNFLSSMFHEILTPINVIIGFIQELTDSTSTVSPEQKEAIDIINQNRVILLNSMNSVVEYLNIERNNADINVTEVSITEIIDFLQKDIEELTQSKGIEFSYGKISSSLRFETDKQKFQHLISTLLRIITEISGCKKIYFSAYQYSDSKFVISVKDSYSNVSEVFLEKVNEVFGGETTKDFGISKLSLKLSKKLLKLLHGNFELLTKADEKSDYGFIFSQKFAFSDDEEITNDTKKVYLTETEMPTPEEIPQNRKRTLDDFEEVSSSRIIIDRFREEDSELIPDKVQIKDKFFSDEDLKIIEGSQEIKKNNKINLSELSCLYIEDQIDSQILFKVQMKELKDIKFAVSFEEALPLLDNYHFDFIVMDINLQGEYNGLDALKIIHKMPLYEKIPIIAVTAYVLPGDKEKFIATGFHDFISKPIFREKLIDSLERIFLMHF